MLWLLLLLMFNVLLRGTCDLISVTWEQVTGPDDLPSLPHFWTSTGLSPLGTANSLLGNDERVNLALLGSLPHGALTHVRVHWLLDLVSARIEDDKIYYDFSNLDTFLDWLQKFNLYPGFELMGNPSGVFSNLSDVKEQRWWQQLIQDIVHRYIGRYGVKNILQWRFETWNEPDLKMYNTLSFTLNSFRAYFLSSMNGITTASNGTLKIGGPAGLFRIPRKHHPLCWGLLDSIVQEQQTDTLAFISFHRKGNASSSLILQGARQLIRQFRRRYPTLKHLPVANDEADPLTGWWRSEEWRADVRYAAMVARGVVDHLHVLVRQPQFPLQFLSNDNAFLSTAPNYFTQRTLLARFQINDTEPTHTQFILKSVYVALALLSLLGDRELPLTISSNDTRVSLLAAGSWPKTGAFSATLLIVVNNETYNGDPESQITFNLTLPLSVWDKNGVDPRYTIFVIDNQRSNPSEVWQQAGAPAFPNQDLRRNMRAAQDSFRLVATARVPESGSISFNLSLPSVALVQLCYQPHQIPAQVIKLQAISITTNEILLVWKDIAPRCLLRYEVEWRSQNTSEFRRINSGLNSILPNFHYDPGSSIRGEYRVRAKDLWHRSGKYSTSIFVSD